MRPFAGAFVGAVSAIFLVGLLKQFQRSSTMTNDSYRKLARAIVDEQETRKGKVVPIYSRS